MTGTPTAGPDAPPTFTQPTLTEPTFPTAPAFARPARAATPFLVALGLGLAAQLLAGGVLTGEGGDRFGVNIPIWVALFVAACLWAVRRRGERPTPEGLTLLGAAFLLSVLTYAVRNVPGEMGVLNGFALWLSLLLGAAFLRFPGLGGWTLWATVGAGFTGALRPIYGPLVLLERLPWARLRPARDSGLRRWGVGALLTLPVLVIFGGLLAGADAGFAGLLNGVLDWRLEQLWSRGLELAVWCAFAGGLVYPAVMALRPSLLPRTGPNLSRLGLVEVGLPLASLAALFVVFLLAQLPYYLSGTALPDGVTFAGYIREGFGQLMTVAFLSLTLLLSAHALTRPEIREGVAYRLLNLAVLAPLALVLLSAANRWRLYNLAYGLSDTRLMGAAFLVWLALCVLLLGHLLWRSRPERFTYPALLLGFMVLLTTTALNPGALIARTNVDRAVTGVTNELRSTPQAVNVLTLLDLGADAVPTIVTHLDALTSDCGRWSDTCPNPRQPVINRLHEKYDAPRDPQAWNASYARAHALVQTLPPPTPEGER
ncbi:DUF4153 domain-containing protein [Deinococcus arenicola]|uniref:DUF4173 domain-containing protein n=1 Tax=Deinococcus arenicola TaxID=2994950 RepID=A0ABU4DPB5_9DEIO|nr:DUF4153 domain-containing protein [Deinococcus sp. ZS9-10]MDV6374266.1 DUF4173 domain-containing protein [Deinococcus sp. ZS9-10]